MFAYFNFKLMSDQR